jgi:hypothetical protein
MTTNLEKLSDALRRDTPEKLLERQIEEHRAEIEQALREGREFVLEGARPLVIKKAS